MLIFAFFFEVKVRWFLEVELAMLVSLGVGWALVLLGFGGWKDLVKIFFGVE
jgi:hypothetical protein